MDSKRIKCFVALAEQLHFSRAADVLYMSQSSLSYNISELEMELGVTLFVRNKRKVLLTATGTALLPLARKFINIAQEMENMTSVQHKREPENRSLNICFDKSYERFDLLGINRAVAELRAEHTDSLFEISHLDYTDLVESVISSQTDIGFATMRPGDNPGGHLNTVRIAKDHFSIAFHSSVNSSIENIMSNLTLCLGANDKRWASHIINILRQLDYSPKVEYVNDLNTIMSLVEMGPYFMMLPSLQAKAEMSSRPNLSHVDLPSKTTGFDYCAIWAKDNYNVYIQQLLDKLELPED